MVNFSRFDLLTHQSVVPPESVYGSFDIVLCRNVLIYYDLNSQNLIWQKLFRSLAKTGYVFLGEAEIPSEDYRHSFKREFHLKLRFTGDYYEI
jgi:chemotaxis methyl-accepting protein methylase